MNIRSVQQSTTKSLSGLNIRRRIFELFPSMVISDSKKANKVGAFISRPDVNRAIMGGTALMTQPIIDYNNPKVDKDTAKVSTARTIGKIIAGTMVGCAVRAACYYGVGAVTKTRNLTSGRDQYLMPNKHIRRFLDSKGMDWLKNYRSILATIIGVGVMLITNVALDVPLTNIITKKMINFFNIKEKSKQPQQDESNNSNPTNYDVRKKFEDIFINKPNSIKKGALNA